MKEALQTPPKIEAEDSREWLLTNGLGSFAAGSISTANTRRYHGLFVAAFSPPVDRVNLVSHLDEIVAGKALAVNAWKSGAIAPEGLQFLESFTPLPVPTWRYQLDAYYLVKQVLMVHKRQSVYVRYKLEKRGADEKVRMSVPIEIAVISNYRDFHSQTKGADNWLFQQQIKNGQGDLDVQIEAFPGAVPFYLRSQGGETSYQACQAWYRDYFYRREWERGLPDSEDCLRLGFVKSALKLGESLTLEFSLEPGAKELNFERLLCEVQERQTSLLQQANLEKAPRYMQQLVLAADQFLVERRSTGQTSVVAGYPWFSDWGRDAMISLNGLCLATGRYEEAKGILATFSKYLSEGMIANFFPDKGEPTYNTADATLLWGEALYRYYLATDDLDFVSSQVHNFFEIIKRHQCGTRHGLKLDTDSLIRGGDRHVQLTWMDAKCGDLVVTPRHGKAVEINALWHNFAIVARKLYAAVYGNMTIYAGYDQAIQKSMEVFWSDEKGYLADVLQDDGNLDWSLRPNQLFAAALSFPLISKERARRMLETIEPKLLTSYGLRSLSPDDAAYRGRYGDKVPADQLHRDLTYHQGTVWPWLLGIWVDARIYAFGKTEDNFAVIRERLRPLIEHIDNAACLGSISEIFDGSPPHQAQGCVSQAWSVAELLRVLKTYPEIKI